MVRFFSYMPFRAVSAVLFALCLAAAVSVGARAQGLDGSADAWVDPWDAPAVDDAGISTADEPAGISAAADEIDEVPVAQSTAPTLGSNAVQRIDRAIALYEEIRSWGGWPRIPQGEKLELGVTERRVALLRERLVAGGDMKASKADPYLFTPQVDAAVKRFQRRNGLKPDGVVGPRTLEMMNVPVSRRIAQLRQNRSRLADMVAKLEGSKRYVFVNIAAQEVEAVADNRVEFRQRVVVGKRDRQTPELSSAISSVILNPYWFVPKSIAVKDKLSKIKADPGYLQRAGFKLMAGWGDTAREINPYSVDWSADTFNRYYLRQDPGKWNALGRVKIDFPNQHAVYLHDTPTRYLFQLSSRSFSSGCVRVKEVRTLASWLLQGKDGWNRARIDATISRGYLQAVGLNQAVPIHLKYITAWVNGDGMVNFRPDIYNRDSLYSTANAQY